MSVYLDVPEGEIGMTDKDCLNCKDLAYFIDLIKNKMYDSTKSEKLKLLTLVPESWTIESIMSEFNVSYRMARTARNLKAQNGILAEPQQKSGRILSDETVQKVIEFYQSDEYSRMFPGKKDVMSVKINGQKQYKQRRLLLLNLNEFHIEFKKRYPQLNIGLSKFCNLRPRWCVSVNAPGAHSVCVCEQHQNVKLLTNVIPGVKDYYELLQIMVCDVTSRECMIKTCENCPGIQALKNYVTDKFSSENSNLDLDDFILYKQWVYNPRITMIDIRSSVDEFIHLLVQKVDSLRLHHFTAKVQAQHLRNLKENLSEGTAVILVDFAENYSFQVQDAIQGFYWKNVQATLHPIVVYTRDRGEVKAHSFCFISDHSKHDTNTVHTFLSHILKYILSKKPIKNLEYFSDGAVTQYKNFKNFANLAMHHKDFGVKANWNFFATSHGKSPCDGIGGVVKRLVSRASLQAASEDQIITPLQMFDWCQRNIKNIKFFYTPKGAIEDHVENYNLEERYSTYVNKIVGTRMYHYFEPIGFTSMKVKKFSDDPDSYSTIVNLKDSDDTDVDFNDLQAGMYVLCRYDQNWYVGLILDTNEAEQDFELRFMHYSHRTRYFTWPKRDDRCWIPLHDILGIVKDPVVHGQRDRTYKLSERDYKKISDISNKCKLT